jgi:Protein of unknown function (DUF2452)
VSDSIENKNVSQNPGLIGYAHTAGSAVIRPTDMGKVKGKAQMAMRQQTQDQLQRLYKQMEVLGGQVKEINDRIVVSERIYDAQMSFEPVINHTYFLYEKTDGSDVLSMVGPDEWGKRFPYNSFLARVFLLADRTWQVVFINDFEQEVDIDIEN